MDNYALTYRFGDFILDEANRELRRGETPVELSARYFDALVLLVREQGRLVEKDRFFDEVWDGVVVSDSALTQCIKDIRKQLGDDASNPRYIQTVPRYGYRFIGEVDVLRNDEEAAAPALEPAPEPLAAANRALPPDPQRIPVQISALWAAGGALGGGFAGIFGGLFYGSALASSPGDAALGTTSILIVMLSVNVLLGIIGGAGVSFGMAAASWIAHRRLGWSILGGAVGGLLVGGGVKLLGVDAFNLIFGRAPAGITGGLEGAALGAAVALGARLGGPPDARPHWRPVAGAGAAGAGAGAAIPALGGNLMGGSLELLARSFDGSRLDLDALGRFFGEVHFGYTTQVILGAVEGLIFCSCVTAALIAARRALLGTRGQNRRAD